MAEAGICEEDCTLKFVAFLLLFLIVMIVTFIVDTIAHAATIRYMYSDVVGIIIYGSKECIRQEGLYILFDGSTSLGKWVRHLSVGRVWVATPVTDREY